MFDNVKRRSSVGVPGVLALSLLLLAGCGTSHPRLRSEPGAAQPHLAAPLDLTRKLRARPICGSVAASRLSDVRTRSNSSLAAVVRREAVITVAANGGGVLARVGRIDENGYPTVLGVVGTSRRHCTTAAYRVQLPTAPNGRSGWISARAVRVFSVSAQIVVSLSRRQLIVYRHSRPLLHLPVAIGSAQTPTPLGNYFVTERWLLANPNGPFGVAALGISAHSNVLHDWVEGGPIAIHGTNEPWTIGQATSHGCVRLSNSDMRRLLPLAPAGTPVAILR